VSSQDAISKVIEANKAVHGKLAAFYEKTEPHFRAENVAIVDARVASVVAKASANTGVAPKAAHLLDLGCGTGFMVGIAKNHVARIVGVDVTRQMLERVDTSGPAKIEVHEHDTGTFPAEAGAFDVVTAYSFLHHLYDVGPTFGTAAKALKKGGLFYADLDPNFYFWEAVTKLDAKGTYDNLVAREIDAVVHKDDEIEREYGISKEVFNDAEYGKNIAGGFKEEVLREKLVAAGFSNVEFTYYWFLGQALLVNDERFPRERRLENARVADEVLQKALPISRHLYKYVGFLATK